MKLELQLLVDGKPYLLDTDDMTIDIMREASEKTSVIVIDKSCGMNTEIDFEIKEMKETNDAN